MRCTTGEGTLAMSGECVGLRLATDAEAKGATVLGDGWGGGDLNRGLCLMDCRRLLSRSWVSLNPHSNICRSPGGCLPMSDSSKPLRLAPGSRSPPPPPAAVGRALPLSISIENISYACTRHLSRCCRTSCNSLVSRAHSCWWCFFWSLRHVWSVWFSACRLTTCSAKVAARRLNSRSRSSAPDNWVRNTSASDSVSVSLLVPCSCDSSSTTR
mmetsp:Transcript_11722/g.28154  ORF Transcript_11722/g.28154 Transcript_11722/m.28154 type:complete len:213 (+) Transcript_11722:39-677(+)